MPDKQPVFKTLFEALIASIVISTLAVVASYGLMSLLGLLSSVYTFLLILTLISLFIGISRLMQKGFHTAGWIYIFTGLFIGFFASVLLMLSALGDSL